MTSLLWSSDLSLTLGVIPEQYQAFAKKNTSIIFCNGKALKRGQDVIAMEMTKWFDTNYHYIVPEFTKKKS
jgi:5-methyltetrahydropteroyltriglutamate--homocysteine methyltransferase